MKDKIRGMMLGVGIGDALGMPVETFDKTKILEKYPESKGLIDKYYAPTGHKWFDGRPGGTWTDDTQLTLATADGLLACKDLNDNAAIMYSIAGYHIDSYDKKGTGGWGRTTTKAVDALKQGISILNSAPREAQDGSGNGIPMKIGPLAAFGSIHADPLMPKLCSLIESFSLMTHYKSIAVSSGFAHYAGLVYCFRHTPETFNIPAFICDVIGASAIGIRTLPRTIKDNLTKRLCDLCRHDLWSLDRIAVDYNNGSCYVYDSLPATYMHFVKNPMSIDSLYNCISMGGDADSNGSMLGALAGALHGEDFWPKSLVKGLDKVDVILNTADMLYDLITFRKANL